MKYRITFYLINNLEGYVDYVKAKTFFNASKSAVNLLKKLKKQTKQKLKIIKIEEISNNL